MADTIPSSPPEAEDTPVDAGILSLSKKPYRRNPAIIDATPESKKPDTDDWTKAILERPPETDYFASSPNVTDFDINYDQVIRRLKLLSRADIADSTYAALDAQIKSAGLTAMPPIYLDRANKNKTEGQSNIVTTREGHNALIINKKENDVWTPDFVRDALSFTDDDIAGAVAKHRLLPITPHGLTAIDIEHLAAQKALSSNSDADLVVAQLQKPDTKHIIEKTGISAETYTRYAEMAKRMGLPYTPDLYFNPDHQMLDSGAAASRTAEGRMDIEVGAKVLLLPPSQQLGILGHELDHQRNNDPSPEVGARVHNLGSEKALEANRAIEARADIEGSEISCQPLGLAKSFGTFRVDKEQTFRKEHPHASYEEFVKTLPEADQKSLDKIAHTSDHPTRMYRIWKLLDMHDHLPAGCMGKEIIDDGPVLDMEKIFPSALNIQAKDAIDNILKTSRPLPK